MPLYEYRCKQCGHIFEKIQSFSAADEKQCPRCAGEVERLISAPAIQFKGSGFYLTDYGKSGATAAAKGGEAGSAPAGASKSGEGSSAGGSANGATASSGTGSGSNSGSTPSSSSSTGAPSGSGSNSSGSSSSGSK